MISLCSYSVLGRLSRWEERERISASECASSVLPSCKVISDK